MKIALLGAGNVATHLSKAFIKAGHPVEQIWSRNYNHAIALSLEIGANSIQDITSINKSIDVVVIAVSDDAIAAVAAQIPPKVGRLIFHTSGSTDINILQNYSQHYGVLYPLQTFSKTADIDFSTVPLCIETNDLATEAVLLKLAKQLSHQVQLVNSQHRLSLHIAAVFACNFTNHFYSIAQQLLKDAQLDFNLIRPLIQETADKAMLNLPTNVQTGPAKRKDQHIMQKHLAMLQQHPQWQNLYALISQDIVKMYPQQQAQDK